MVTSTIFGRMVKRVKGRIYNGFTFYTFSIGWCKARDDKGKDYWFASLEELNDFIEAHRKIRYRHVQEYQPPELIVSRY